jgi:hypothetical protein
MKALWFETRSRDFGVSVDGEIYNLKQNKNAVFKARGLILMNLNWSNVVRNVW